MSPKTSYEAAFLSCSISTRHRIFPDGDFEISSLSDWKGDIFDAFRTSGGAFSGNWKLTIPGGLWSTLYQDFKIPSDRSHPRLLVRARLKSGNVSLSRLIILITDRGAVVYVPVYDGPLSANWVTYAADLTSVVNRDARLEIKTYTSSFGRTIYVDAAAVYSSRLPTHQLDCLHLWINDSTVGSDFSLGQVFLGEGNALRDAVVWNNSWGGDYDGSTLSRTSPWAPSTEQSSWRSGPYAGTPAMPNN